jgi:hypothetical protein
MHHAGLVARPAFDLRMTPIYVHRESSTPVHGSAGHNKLWGEGMEVPISILVDPGVFRSLGVPKLK